MSVPEQVPYKEYRATGSNNTFEITFHLPDPKDLVVMVNKEIPLVGAYSVQGNTVVFNTAPNEGDLVELTRDTQLDRETNFKSYDNSFRPETINFDLDKIWLVLQEQNLVDAKILARLKAEIEWRRTHDFNYDELAQVREKQLFDALKGYTDTLLASTNPGVFQGVIAGVVFARDGKSIQTHIEEILNNLELNRSYIDEQVGLMAPQATTYNKVEVDTKINAEATRAQVAEQVLQDQVNAVGVGNKAYLTYAEMDADKANNPINSKLEVTNDPDPAKNGTYQWNGTTLTKSPYDPLAQSKNYTDQETAFWQADSGITIQGFDAFSKYAVGFVGQNNIMPLSILKSGEVVVEKININDASVDTLDISNTFLQKLDKFTGFSFGISGNGDKYPILLRNNGEVVIEKLKAANIEKRFDEFSQAADIKRVIQEWWISPVHTYVDFPYPRVISGVYSEDGEIIVSEYVLGSGTTKQFSIDSTPVIDDHNAPSLWIKKNRRALVIWTQHGLTNNLEMKVSDKYADIRTLKHAARQEINVGNSVTYTQLHHVESLSDEFQDTFYLLSRVTFNAWNLIKLSVNQDTGVVTMLSNQQILSATQQYYCSSVFDEENSIIRIASAYNPAASLNTIHYWEIDINSGEIKDHTDTVRANFLTPANLPISVESVAALIPQSDSNVDRRLHYVRPAPASGAIAYAEWSLTDVDNAVYKVIASENGSWNIRDVANAGKRFGYTANANYISGISFPNPCYRDEVFVARYDNATNQGVLERAMLVDNAYVKTESLRVDKNHLLRPMNPVNGGDICMYTQLYEYGTTSTFSFVSDVKSLILE